MNLLDSKYVDVKVEAGIVKVEFPLVALLEELAKSSDNKIDDVIVDLVKKALEVA